MMRCLKSSLRMSRLRNTLLVRTKISLFFGIDGMGNARRLVIAVKAEDPITNREVRCCEAFPLAEIIYPGFHDESLLDMTRIAGVLKDAPTHGAITQSHILHLMDRVDEAVVVLWIDVVVDQDTYWSIGHLRLHGELRRRRR